ncbi:S-layer homology domain-containing protein [Deinococcus sp. HMF7604]|uniref:S-layer homology domain-containing protein n=1 Tax=Deinococcus betulae TaxID=2873312 RepID=UPI001CCF34BB|nr:S-layer homology domain-containing protein [Deinococcus betulae]MBZ9750122.1 S-layer homology domain-containing protein [Deinococcus betulae]
MKKSLLVLTAALSFGVAAAQTTAPASAPQVPALTDVPAGHWAKDAIDRLVSTGIILGYPDGTFRGTQNLTRYEAAVIIARLLDQMRTGDVAPSDLDPETLTALQNAIQELAADLAALGVRVSDLEENAVSRDDFARLEERVEMIAAASGDPEALAGIAAQIEELTARADEYDTLRADVDDNASSIAALNDLTVLLNQDILNLQDRVSAVEAAQADLVARADFDNLAGRVGVVETKVTNLDNRVAQLERYAFTIKPTLAATYYVARASRNMDLDRLIPGTVFSTGTDDNTNTNDTAVDWADLTGGDKLVINNQANFYGFSSTGNAGTDGNAVYNEGQTTISFGITFNTPGGAVNTSRSDVRGAFVPGPGGLNVNTVDVTFGITAGLPSTAADDAGYSNYPDVTDGDTGITYRPLFFYFRNATANFTVGNAPITVTFGKSLKFKFADYIGDNDYAGRGDGFLVNVDGSTLPVIGAFKPTIQTVYGSRGGVNSDGLYYRGVRATITPVGTLKAGIHYLQEGRDIFGNGTAAAAARTAATGVADNPATTANEGVAGTASTFANDVTTFGADLHGTVGGWQLDSEYATSRVNATTFTPNATAGGTPTAATATTVENAFYVKTSGNIGTIAKVYNLNFRTISAGYNATAGIMEANPTDTYSTAPYAANQTGFGVKIGTTLGPVALGGYWDNQVAYGKSPLNTATELTAIVDRGITAKVNLLNLVTVRGGYYEYLKSGAAYDRVNTVEGAGVRYNVRADLTPGLGITLGAYYRDLRLGNAKSQSDGGLFRNSLYNSYYTLTSNELTDQDGCGDQHPGIRSTDVDGVGRALTFSQNSFTDPVCYSEYGVELAHSGKDAAALVKNLDVRLGYASRYRNFGSSYSNSFFYGDALYSAKLGVAQVDLKAGFSNDTYSDAERNDPRVPASQVANSTAIAAGLKIVTDPLNTIFRPSFEGQIGYYSRTYDYGTFTPYNDPNSTTTPPAQIGPRADFQSMGLRYLAGVKFNDFLLPNTKLAVYYAGYQAKNRGYIPFTGLIDAGTAVAGRFTDQYNNNETVSQDLLYVEGNYYDLSFGYGVGNLRLRNSAGQLVTPTGAGAAIADGRGQVFKISYKVNF